ncbi:MAG: hypothetical protein ACI4J8_00680 [Oscillospiraceae bacterium]
MRCGAGFRSGCAHGTSERYPLACGFGRSAGVGNSDRDLKVTFVFDSAKSWKTDGAEITAPADAELAIYTTSNLKTGALRGAEGIQFTVN